MGPRPQQAQTASPLPNPKTEASVACPASRVVHGGSPRNDAEEKGVQEHLLGCPISDVHDCTNLKTCSNLSKETRGTEARTSELSPESALVRDEATEASAGQNCPGQAPKQQLHRPREHCRARQSFRGNPPPNPGTILFQECIFMKDAK